MEAQEWMLRRLWRHLNASLVRRKNMAAIFPGQSRENRATESGGADGGIGVTDFEGHDIVKIQSLVRY